MVYLAAIVILTLVLLGYFVVARRFKIIDKPNERSSHKNPVVRGGGVLFPIAALLWFFVSGFQYPYFVLGILLISGISFLDDIYTLSTKPRLAIHLLSVALIFYEIGFENLDWWAWILVFILVIGWINAFNFMDGINAITAFYSIALLLSFLWIQNEIDFSNPQLMVLTFFAVLIFGFFNARKKAKTFAGDVGSISLAFLFAFLILQLILKTGQWHWIGLFSVYGVDAVLTIVHRLFKKENIFKAHRSHLYQYLANEMEWSHVSVSTLYALLQMAVNAILIFVLIEKDISSTFVLVTILIFLGIIYIISKMQILRKLRYKIFS